MEQLSIVHDRQKTVSKLANSICKLPINSREFRILLNEFHQWLHTLGYAKSTVYYSPAYVRSFLHFLERMNIDRIKEVRNNHLLIYFNWLS